VICNRHQHEVSSHFLATVTCMSVFSAPSYKPWCDESLHIIGDYMEVRILGKL